MTDRKFLPILRAKQQSELSTQSSITHNVRVPRSLSISRTTKLSCRSRRDQLSFDGRVSSWVLYTSICFNQSFNIESLFFDKRAKRQNCYSCNHSIAKHYSSFYRQKCHKDERYCTSCKICSNCFELFSCKQTFVGSSLDKLKELVLSYIVHKSVDRIARDARSRPTQKSDFESNAGRLMLSPHH